MGYILDTKDKIADKNKMVFTLGPNGGVYSLPAGTFIESILVVNNDQSFNQNIGTTPGGTQIALDEPVLAGITRSITINQALDVPTTLYFDGPNDSDTTYTIYKNSFVGAIPPPPPPQP